MHAQPQSSPPALELPRGLLLANVGAFTGALVVVGVLFMVMPRLDTSEIERRSLATLPALDLDSLASGDFTRGVDVFIADHIPFREALVETAFWLRDHRGPSGALWAPATPEATVNPAAEISQVEPLVEPASPLPDSPDETPPIEVAAAGSERRTARARLASSGPPRPQAAITDGKLKKKEGLLIVDGQAMHPFKGNDKDTEQYAKTLNGYDAILGDDIKIYTLLVPSPAAFYLPKEYARHSYNEPRYIEKTYGQLSAGIQGLNVYDVLAKHKDEYIYFRTDHHWTVLGAYYAYVTFIRAAGMKPRPLSDFKRKVHDDHYVGTWFGRTRSMDLKRSPDRVDYYVPDTEHSVEMYKKNDPERAVPGLFIREKAPNYGIFLGGDFPLMVAKTPHKNGRRVLVVKNSLGNPFVVWLLSHFEKIIVIDYRYFKGNILDVIDEHEVTDLVFINGILTSSTEVHTSLIRRLKKKRKP
jgi:hypothetical protein